MKVNIGGRGRVPFVGFIAPLRNYEMDQYMATNLLRYSTKFPLYESETGIRITYANIRGIFNGNRKLELSETINKNDSNDLGEQDNLNVEMHAERMTKENCDTSTKMERSTCVETDPVITLGIVEKDETEELLALAEKSKDLLLMPSETMTENKGIENESTNEMKPITPDIVEKDYTKYHKNDNRSSYKKGNNKTKNDQNHNTKWNPNKNNGG